MSAPAAEISVDHRDRIATIRIQRPNVLNALNNRCVLALAQLVSDLDRNPDVAVVVITGEGGKAFSAGADIADLGREQQAVDALRSDMQDLYNTVEGLSKPTVAALNGLALGGGLELAMACDIRIAVNTARFALPELALSVLPAAGGTQRLARLIGQGRAMEMILTGRMIDAAEAQQIGLVSRVCPPQSLQDNCDELCTTLLSKGPLALRLAKQLVRAALQVDIHSGMAMESLAQAVLFSSDDKREGTTAFLEKRPPHFKGR